MAYKLPKQEPVAIVGSSCRFAGDATTPSALWDLLKSPTDLSKEVPAERFNIKAFYHPDGEYHGTTNSPKAYWLEQDHRIFDATFFNITPKEAEAIDPQQRMQLEVVYEALESAGYTLQQYAGQNVAVFSGVMTADYDTLSQRDDLTASQYYATGNARSIISNRVSYFFNFNGPSMTVDTACSSSLVALHQAVLSLRSGESIMACVTGVNLMLVPEQFIVESNLHMLSPTGHCRMWDANADGYARGEGVAALFLKPLSRAIIDGDQIQAIIRETGVNSDGRTKGITMPNPQAQARLIRETYQRARLDPSDPADRCQFFEAHGTGTQAGDPTEASAIEEAFFGTGATHEEGREDPNPHTPPQPRLLVGSVKTVIGHTEGAAGLAGVLKVMLAMLNSTVPPNLHLQTLNPRVKPFYSNLVVPTEAQAWPSVPEGQPKRASVNSFGFGGTNSHAIIEEYVPAIHRKAARAFCATVPFDPTVPYSVDSDAPSPVLPLLLSGNSQKALVTVAETYLDYLTKDPSLQLEQLGWHTYTHRTALPFKVSVSATTHGGLCQSLQDLVKKASGSQEPVVGSRTRPGDAGPKILGVFTGQGAQWATMSSGLLRTSTLYRDAIRDLDHVLQQCPFPPSWSLEQEILAQEGVSRVGKAAISQPLCTAIQIGLVDILKSMGVHFHTVVGHSSGEIAAAYAAGRLTARDAMLISYYRGMYAHLAGGKNGKKGGMIAVGLSKQEAVELCSRKEYRGGICIAASNAPSSVTLSGDLDVVEKARDDLIERKIFARMLQIDKAYHSPHIEAPAIKYLEALATTRVSPDVGNGTIWVSSVYGMGKPSPCDLEAKYWKDNMVQPVLFHEALQTALRQQGPFNLAIEVGPHPTLKGPATQTMKAVNGSAIPYAGLLDRKKDDRLAFAEFIGTMWTQFGPTAIQLRPFVINSSRPNAVFEFLQEAPTYPWDHSQSYYRESRIAHQYHFRTHPPHELLGVRTRDDDEYELRWRNILKLDKIPWMQHHKFQGQALLPASGYCVMARDAAKVVLAGRRASLIELEDLVFESGITVEPDSQGVETLFSLTLLPTTRENRLHSTIDATFTVTSAPADGLTPLKKNCHGKLRIVLEEPSRFALPPREAWHAEALKVSKDGFYQMMAETGLDYTGPFKGLLQVERRLNFSSTTLMKRHDEDTTTMTISPATFDTCLQSCFLTYSSPGDKALWTSFLPTTMERVRFNLAICDMEADDPEAMLAVDAYLTNIKPTTKDSAASFTGDICIYNEVGEMEIQVEGLTVASFAATRPENDYELYLTTVVDVDPEEEIVAEPVLHLGQPCLALVESCERVASFYLKEAPARTPFRTPRSSFSLVPDYGPMIDNPRSVQNQWPYDTTETVTEFIIRSPHHVALEFIRMLGDNLPDILLGMLPTIIEEAHQLVGFQQHLGRIVRQICHRYPHVNVLGLTDPELGFTGPILSAIKGSFHSYTLGTDEKGIEQLLQPHYREKVILKKLDLEGEVRGDEASDYDAVILSTSIMKAPNTHLVLKRLRSKMKAGAFLILVHVSRSPLKNRIKKAAGFRSDIEAQSTPPDWPDVLDECGFTRAMRNSHQYYPPGFAVIIRQADSDLKLKALQPLRDLGDAKLTEHLLIVGGKTERTSLLSKDLCQQLSSCSTKIITADTFEHIEQAALSSFTATIFLSDLDDPVLLAMTDSRLETLKALIKPQMTILWVTLNARYGNPDQAASFGFGRTIIAETPDLALRLLDLDTLDNAVSVISEEFARLCTPAMASSGKAGEILWSNEPEVHMENGHRLVPRVMPWTDANNRVNAPRRLVTTPVNTLDHVVEIVPLQARDGSVCYESKLTLIKAQATDMPDQVTIKVDYSSVDLLQLGLVYPCHVCIGRDMRDGHLVVALAKSNGSFVTVSRSSVKSLENQGPINTPLFISLLVRYLTSLSIADNVRDKSLVLIDPEDMLYDCVREVLFSMGTVPQVVTADPKRSQSNAAFQLLHLNSTYREIQGLFPRDGAYIFDFLPETSKLSDMVQLSMPDNCEYHGRYSLLASANLNTHEDASVVQALWNEAATLALAKAAEMAAAGFTEVPPMLSAEDLLHSSDHTEAFRIVDWKKERVITHVIKPVVEEHLLRPYKTYLLVGMTRDLGQSLCRLFIKHGARNIVLVSRNPPDAAPKWMVELNAAGANIHIDRLDVTNLEEVRVFKHRLEDSQSSMPPVAGIVNGAMVLDDRVFSQMTAEVWNRVMAPKALGSKNLDIVFDSPDMEFFIMTSSFAATGGHSGQSNYAAANMYMNGLAASRRSRGLPGTALNIGVIYGLGFLHREKEQLYAGLEREGYLPISERDIHHMFLEAIVAGRPAKPALPGMTIKQQSQVYDITMGLRRFRVNDPNPLSWHLDPRFSHFSVGSGAAGEISGDVDDETALKRSVKQMLENVDNVVAAAEIILERFTEHLERLLQLPKGSAHPYNSIAELGVDSLVAVEIRSWFYKSTDTDVGVMKILGATSITKLVSDVAAGVISSSTPQPKAPETAATDVGTVREAIPIPTPLPALPPIDTTAPPSIPNGPVIPDSIISSVSPKSTGSGVDPYVLPSRK